ncbi:hypothetical protein [Streptomyces sp. AM 2-1-1]|uniref:hypothetical protein n=1 Tax=Streptomyces sp. AM 2-1-1 TaxID=3028709 RepID=UPI0023BA278D|nr:hypothetical protein [Streptomyces sp. AM 2-1-1]WEH41939.1 hypothetical protein PZB77_21930 [Streptomyces sp. AM 2-1-1]
MFRCTAVALLPPTGRAVRAEGSLAEPRPVRCVLGERHRDEHACPQWDDDRLGSGVWVRWAAGAMYRVVLLRCTHYDEVHGPCRLFDDHPSGHSGEVVDPAGNAEGSGA